MSHRDMKTKIMHVIGYGIAIELGLWCLTPLSSIFQLYRDGQFS